MDEVRGFVCTRASLANLAPCRPVVQRGPWSWLRIDWSGRWTT